MSCGDTLEHQRQSAGLRDGGGAKVAMRGSSTESSKSVNGVFHVVAVQCRTPVSLPSRAREGVETAAK
jgi:hypothetical protein